MVLNLRMPLDLSLKKKDIKFEYIYRRDLADNLSLNIVLNNPFPEII